MHYNPKCGCAHCRRLSCSCLLLLLLLHTERFTAAHSFPLPLPPTMQMILQFRDRLLARARVCLLACLLLWKRLACLIREQTQVKRGKTRERERELILVPLRFCYFSTFTHRNTRQIYLNVVKSSKILDGFCQICLTFSARKRHI